VDGVHRERALHADQAAYPRVGRLQLKARQTVRHRGRTGAAVPGKVHAEQSDRGELLHQVADGYLAALVPVGDVRAYPVVDEAADHRPDVALLGAVQAVEVEQVEGG